MFSYCVVVEFSQCVIVDEIPVGKRVVHLFRFIVIRSIPWTWLLWNILFWNMLWWCKFTTFWREFLLQSWPRVLQFIDGIATMLSAWHTTSAFLGRLPRPPSYRLPTAFVLLSCWLSLRNHNLSIGEKSLFDRQRKVNIIHVMRVAWLSQVWRLPVGRTTLSILITRTGQTYALKVMTTFPFQNYKNKTIWFHPLTLPDTRMKMNKVPLKLKTQRHKNHATSGQCICSGLCISRSFYGLSTWPLTLPTECKSNVLRQKDSQKVTI